LIALLALHTKCQIAFNEQTTSFFTQTKKSGTAVPLTSIVFSKCRLIRLERQAQGNEDFPGRPSAKTGAR